MINEQRKIGFDDLGIRANSVDLQLYAPNAYKFIYLGQFFFSNSVEEHYGNILLYGLKR